VIHHHPEDVQVAAADPVARRGLRVLASQARKVA
jgi:hypothetical protein